MSFEPRERILAAAGLVLIAAAAVWTYGWTPLVAREATIAQDRAILADVAQKLTRLEALGFDASAMDQDPKGPLLDRVSRHAEGFGLGVRQLVPQPDGLQVATEEVAFTLVLEWLAAITQDEALTITSAQIARQPTPGMVTAQVVLGGRQ